MLRIVGDANIPYLHDAFGALGQVDTLPAREITRERVRDVDLLLVRSTIRVDRALLEGSRSRDFWLLFGTFFICGLSTNGLIGTHLIAACFDAGIPEVKAAGLLAMMGIFDLIGTTLSGWLSDRYNNRYLLAWYYGLLLIGVCAGHRATSRSPTAR